MKRLLLFILICFAWLHTAQAAWLDKGDSVFFPTAFGQTLQLYKSFPTGWWNFLIVESHSGEDAPQLQALCAALQREGLVTRIECGDSLHQLLPIAEAWARDLPLREPAPSREKLKEAFAASLAQASLPLPSELLSILRADPLQTYRALQDHSLKRQPLSLERREGFFYDKTSGRWVIPFQPSFASGQSDPMEKLLGKVSQLLPSFSAWVIGPHASAQENRAKIQTDLERVSKIGTLLMLAFIITVWALHRLPLLWGIPMIFIGAGVGALATIAVFGSIHGIVLSFGMGIMGLLIDYTIHAAFDSRSMHVWHSNFMGLATTAVAFLVLWFSQIPLLRQLAFFSLVGLIVSYGFIYFIHRKFGQRLSVAPLAFQVRTTPATSAFIFIVFLGFLAAPWALKPQFDMHRFDFQSAKTSEHYRWLGQHLRYRKPLLEVLPGETSQALEAAQARSDWARSHGIEIENSAVYFPSLALQKRHLASWQKLMCETKPALSVEESRFFSPFLQSTHCSRLQALVPGVGVPLYARDLASQGKWLTIWLPETESQRAQIGEAFPQATSLSELVRLFPTTIAEELSWMIPVTFLFILALLWGYYRRLKWALIALFPFAISMGFLVWARALGMPFSFVSLVGVIMLLGLGVDYGIFAMDHALGKERSQNTLASSLLFSAITTIAGYLPLVFCGHQVLAHLGQVLTLGTLGSLLGCFWAVPLLYRWWGR